MIRTIRRSATTTFTCCAALDGGLLLSTTVSAQTSADPSTLPVPVYDLHLDQKVLLVELEFTGPSSATLISSEVLRGRAHGRAAEAPFLRLDSVAHDGSVLETAGSLSPVQAFVVDPVTGAESFVTQDRGRGWFYLPFSPQLRRLAVTNREAATPVGSFDLEPAIAAFCDENPTDEDCRTDLVATLSASPDPVVAGTVLTYTAALRNDGPNPAHDAALRLQVPEGLTPGTLPAGCTTSGLTVTCDVGLLTVDAVRSFTVPVAVAADLVHVAGAPLTVEGTATAVNGDAVDLNSSDDTAPAATLAVARADLAVDAVTAAAPAALLIGEPTSVPVSTEVSSAGPSSPMDAVVDRTVTSSAGVTASPSSSSSDVPALAAGSPRTVSSPVSVTCTAPGDQTVTVTDTVRPGRPDDADPASGNDTRATTFTVDCVLPVALSTKPSGNPDPVTRTMPMAVLTTQAGEYGLPLAVDATRIDPLSARFGPQSVFSGTGGTSEVHRRGHVEDSTERDLVTRDGDRDMVLHHRTAGSGLTPADTTACLRGKYRAPSGGLWTFFGCDTVRP